MSAEGPKPQPVRKSEPSPASEDSQAARVEQLFRDHNEALLRFLLARVGSYQEAREVAQEAYVRLLSLDKPDAVSYLQAFLFKTAANIAIDRKRRDVRQGRARELPVFQDFADILTPERRIASQQTLSRLERLIAAMPPNCRRAFVLNQFYGVPFAAIAREMNLSESMIRKYVMRALLHCRARLDLEESRND